MAFWWISLNVHNSNWTSKIYISSSSTTFQNVLDTLKTWQPTGWASLYKGDVHWTWQEIWLSLTEWWTPLTLSNLVTSVFPAEWIWTLYALYPVLSDTLKIYSDDTKTTLLWTYEADWSNISINSIASNIWISIPQNANWFYYSWAIYWLNDSITFPMAWEIYDWYFTYPEPTITGFYLDWTEYKFEWWWWTEYNAWQWISISQENVISNSWVLSVNGQTGAVTIQTGSNYTAGNWIDITNKKIWLNGTYEGTVEWEDYSAMQWPAPSGFHVPTRDELRALYTILITEFSLARNNTTMGTYLKMPMAGRRNMNRSDLEYAGKIGMYWSSIWQSDTNANEIQFDSSSINFGGGGRREGFCVRCLKDSPVVPTSSWTTLYDGSSIATGAWVFYNSTDWLISLSSDWKTWYTIMDKNLWATTVYNQWDTLTDANCWYFYQWGNNYWFPHSWTVTTSATPVDASNYWPWNYYNSSTFITRGPAFDWSSVLNNNLWWWETWIQPFKISWNLVVWDKLYKIVKSTTAPASWTASNIITIVTD